MVHVKVYCCALCTSFHMLIVVHSALSRHTTHLLSRRSCSSCSRLLSMAGSPSSIFMRLRRPYSRSSPTVSSHLSVGVTPSPAIRSWMVWRFFLSCATISTTTSRCLLLHLLSILLLLRRFRLHLCLQMPHLHLPLRMPTWYLRRSLLLGMLMPSLLPWFLPLIGWYMLQIN